MSIQETSLPVDSQVIVAFANEIDHFQVFINNKNSSTNPQSGLDQLNLSSYNNPFTLIKNFKSISSQKALSLIPSLDCELDLIFNQSNLLKSENDPNYKNFENWDLETKFWHLLDVLISFRISEEGSNPTTNNLNSGHSPLLDSNYKNIKEIWLIILWLQSNFPNISASLKPKIQNSKWLNTKLSIQEANIVSFTNTKNKISSTNKLLLYNNKKKNSTLIDNYVSNLDPDSIFIQYPKTIHSLDFQSDEAQFKYIYSMILSKNYPQALEYCKETNNWNLYLILSGYNKQFQHSEDFIQVNALKFWRDAVSQLSIQPNLSIYEKAIYSYLSGTNLQNNLEISNSWENHFLIFSNFLFTKILNESHQNGFNFIQSKIDNKNRYQDKNYEDSNYNTRNIDTIEDILNILSLDKSNAIIKKQSQHSLRTLIGSIISNKINKLIESFISQQSLNAINLVDNSTENKYEDETLIPYPVYENSDIDNANDFEQDNILRILTHLSISLKIIDDNLVSDLNLNSLILLYLNYLFDWKFFNLIPNYINFITINKLKIQAFLFYLSKIFNIENKKKVISISGRFLKIDEFNTIIKETVNRAFSKTSKYYDLSLDINKVSISFDVTLFDRNVCRNVEWLILNDMNIDGVEAIAGLFRRLFLAGRLGSLKEFYRRHDFKKIIKKADSEFVVNKMTSQNRFKQFSLVKLELLEYINFFSKSIEVFDKYKEFLSEHDLVPNEDSRSWHSFEVNSYLNSEIIKPLKRLIDSFLIELTRDRRKEIDDDTLKTLENIRALYIPFLIINLHEILINSRFGGYGKEFLTKALSLAVQVADGNNKLYEHFRKGNKLRQYLKMVAHAAALASKYGEQGLYTVLQ
ncbi:Nup84p ASCRUDRAFT_109737 [Ascoidea rubescens DSM 1968]|uniref:Nuclear pore complex protein n=1 Tax=Ascoidea rubescens DSM 1968 TaxID=1344418 RepID=A0A1D2VD17_9ASCO|nr:hypothetical protein ASCRUDRAFT_109737 [Ascoidea rubescens DSM 1968]ODV59594.1 hypothetical protein ASCRUDRAFT_109737 [Ascoidea rubescens DSM 1968]